MCTGGRTDRRMDGRVERWVGGEDRQAGECVSGRLGGWAVVGRMDRRMDQQMDERVLGSQHEQLEDVCNLSTHVAHTGIQERLGSLETPEAPFDLETWCGNLVSKPESSEASEAGIWRSSEAWNRLEGAHEATTDLAFGGGEVSATTTKNTRSLGAISIGPTPGNFSEAHKFPGHQFPLALNEPWGLSGKCLNPQGAAFEMVHGVSWQVSGARLAECPAASSAPPGCQTTELGDAWGQCKRSGKRA
eukprot:360366-Chlamydomonas_euryale.AAC.1